MAPGSRIRTWHSRPRSFTSTGNNRACGFHPVSCHNAPHNCVNGTGSFSRQQLEFELADQPKRRMRRIRAPQEFKIISLRESPESAKHWLCETPEVAVEYWRTQVATAPWYSPDRECSVVILLNARHRIIGHNLVTIGLLNMAIIHPREAFRAAIIAAAHSIILGHNHPSGDPRPSDADIKATRELVRAGQFLRIPLIDHIVIGEPEFSSLKEMGVFE